MRNPIITIAILAAPLAAAAQTPPVVTADDYARAEQFLGMTTRQLMSGIPGRPTWLEDGRAWYRVSSASGTRFILVNPDRRTRGDAFDHMQLARALSDATGNTVSGDSLPIMAIELTNGGTLTVRLRVARGQWVCDVAAYTCGEAQAGELHDPPRASSVSPDGTKAAFIRDHNLWVRDLTTGEDTQLTTDGVEDFGYATNNAGWVKRDNPVLTWSPDSKKIATFQHDGRGVSRMHLVRTTVGEPVLQSWRYPLPGDSVIFRVERVVIHLDGPDAPRVVRLDMPPDAHRSMVTDHIACSGARICDLLWYPDGSALAFVSSSRDHKHAWVRVADANTGEVRTLFEETSQTQIGDASANENWWLLAETNELIWWSQRDNWIHLYLYDLETGELKNPITTGDGNVADIVHVDEDDRTIYFIGQGRESDRDPYFRHLYKVGFDGSRLTLLTPENANHTVSLRPDAETFIDTYSTPTTPPVSVLRDSNGRELLELERGDVSRLVATGWHPPTPVTMKGRDGTTDIYGLMFTPTDLDSTAKYPIIDYIYPGPQSGSVGSRSFSPARGDHQALAELGFIVVAIDGMGTPGRSKAFHDAYYGRMGDNTLPDQVTGIQQLAARYPWIDVERVGIWGHSGGGFATAAAMFRFPDFFKVGISESGNHDNRNYEDDWGERYQGLLVSEAGSDNYDDEANQTHAANLKGKLLLAHGGMDSNVPPYNTYLVVDALIKANKDFDLIVFPNAGHGFGRDSFYMMRRRWDYFVRHLLGAEPPENYQIGRQMLVP
ncbi:MAG: DPP IV N-terminal domain-containing protein [Gemmatimonadota bacterium]|nr:MAG: DPP IV N-terminal domain-containing protein [Gemmatimonadota bacterium]